MAFFRFNRDKRGYEHFYLVEPVTNRRGKSSQPRVLYWYRTPPGIRVGRPPFDEEVRRTLEAQNPGVTFDWKAIVATPMPPPEPEHWRERRRVERAERQAQREDAEIEITPPPGDGAAEPVEALVVVEPAPLTLSETVTDPGLIPTALPSGDSTGRRRRRRGGRHR